jgi:hypothetical protein
MFPINSTALPESAPSKGTIFAIGFPRFVITTVKRLALTLSISFRHVGLNCSDPW